MHPRLFCIPLARKLLSCTLVLLLGQCCPEVQTLDGRSQTTSDGGQVSTVTARLSSIQQVIFDHHCVTDCHESLSAAASLQLSPGRSYKNLVNERSQQVSSSIRVLPGNADASYLIKKMLGGAGMVGDQMPKLAPPRPSTEIEWIRIWINRGAPDD